MKGFIRNIIEISPVDGPGNRTVIFLQGCNFNCMYCHNPETIEIVNSASDDVKEMDTKEVLEIVLKNRSFIRGVTISGGECTVQFPFLIELLKEFSQAGISAYVDTNGHFNSEQRELLIKFCDKIMLDVKESSEEKHKFLTGVSNVKVLENLEALLKVDKIYEVRTVIVPMILDNENTVKSVSEIISKYDSGIRYKLIKFRNHGVRKELKNISSPSDEYMVKLKGIAENEGLKNIIIV
ncbi:MAG: radical SAM protein [Firmicutes bacterium]|jgi:anaerobic ribonucleoside-triphosphate reductase activating protein|nr:radical SAM protein [Bacillota bacterium]